MGIETDIIIDGVNKNLTHWKSRLMGLSVLTVAGHLRREMDVDNCSHPTPVAMLWKATMDKVDWIRVATHIRWSDSMGTIKGMEAKAVRSELSGSDIEDFDIAFSSVTLKDAKVGPIYKVTGSKSSMFEVGDEVRIISKGREGGTSLTVAGVLVSYGVLPLNVELEVL